MIYKNWLQTDYPRTNNINCPELKENIQTDCLVIGGGMAGLHAALRLTDSGRQVVLLEKNICGGSSSGKSAGFLTPDSEEDFRKLVGRYGKKKAKLIYHIPSEGVNLIVETAKKYNFICDLRKQHSLYFSTKPSHSSIVEEEAEAREANGLSYRFLNQTKLQSVHPGRGYLLGLRYPGSYGINSFAYCQELKKLLLEKGVKIYEHTEVDAVGDNTAKTRRGAVAANCILVCIDKMTTEFHEDFSKKYFPVQTYVTVSEPISEKQMAAVFPDGELMCWDTKWDYIHYRPIAGGRILIGGSSPWTSYSSHRESPRVISSFIKKFKYAFPIVSDVEFNYYWSGLIDVTKDLVPIVDYDKHNKSLQYAMACAGLNWAAYCGDYMAKRVVDPNKTADLTEFLGAERKFWVSDNIQRVLGKRISFLINHLYELLK